MQIVAELGKPTVFITATCNPLWPEITRRLFGNQTAFDRHDIVVPVFQGRLKALLLNIRHGIYFDEATVLYEMRVIEYQHRGLPHAHIVLQLSGSPAPHEAAAAIAWIDKHISATTPILTDMSSAEDTLYSDYVTKHMVHTCASAVNGCLKNDICKRRYSCTTCKPSTYLDERNYPVYRRPLPADLKIVPHNRQILLDWNGHINVEYCGKDYTVLYLYKYLYKGSKKTILKLKENGQCVIHNHHVLN